MMKFAINSLTSLLLAIGELPPSQVLRPTFKLVREPDKKPPSSHPMLLQNVNENSLPITHCIFLLSEFLSQKSLAQSFFLNSMMSALVTDPRRARLQRQELSEVHKKVQCTPRCRSAHGEQRAAHKNTGEVHNAEKSLQLKVHERCKGSKQSIWSMVVSTGW